MAIKFTDKTDKVQPAPGRHDAQPQETAREVGEARFATPMETVAPVNPDAASELPFTELAKAETKKRPRKR